MEKEALIAAMKRSISEVLETMFFLPLDFCDSVNLGELWHSGKDDIVATKLNFTGPFAGYFLFFVPKELALSLTASFLGKEEEGLSQDHVGETVKEIMNMTAGNAFSILDDQAVFDLAIPQLVGPDEVEGTKGNADEVVFVGINTLENSLGLKMVMRSNG